MTRDVAKRILALHQPWTAHAPDEELRQALALCETDAELRAWLERQQAAHSTVRSALRSISAPAGLKEQILSERPAALRSPRTLLRLATVATLLAILIGTGVWLSTQNRLSEELGFAAYRTRMVKIALRTYGMDFETNSPAAIRAYLAANQAHADYVLPPTLAETTSTGCGVLSWQGKPVSMVCFHSGRPLPAGEKTDVFLFVTDRSAVADAPAGREPEITKVNRLITASWIEGDRVYLLAMPDEEELLKRFL